MHPHLIIGGNGTIGQEVARELDRQGIGATIASRNPKKVVPGNATMALDVFDAGSLAGKLKGVEIVYLILGLPYNGAAWMRGFPDAVRNLVEACAQTGAKLVYFDNVYMYGPVSGWMTEETPVQPSSLKGEARAKAAQILMDGVELGKVEAMICRSADFYGDYPLFDTVKQAAEKLKAGKKAQLLITDQKKHSWTYVPDAGKAVAQLGQRPEAYNQIWHMPTDRNALTGKELIECIAELLGTEARYSVAPKFILKLLGLFNGNLREIMKLSYQWEQDYLFDSAKIEKEMGILPTPMREGIREHLSNKGLLP